MKSPEYVEGIMCCLTNRLRKDMPSIFIPGNNNNRLKIVENAVAYDWMLEKDKKYCNDLAEMIISSIDKSKKAITQKQITEISFPGKELPFVDMVLQCGPNTAIAIAFLSKSTEYARVTGIWQDPKGLISNWTGNEGTDALMKTSSEVEEILKHYAGQSWNEVPDKETVLLLPLIQSLETELTAHCSEDSKSASKFVEQLLPRCSDYYQFRITDKGILSIYYDIEEKYSKLGLPTRMLSCRRKFRARKLSNSTLEMVFDNGWNLELRLIASQKTVSRRGLRYEITLKTFPVGVSIEEYENETQ